MTGRCTDRKIGKDNFGKEDLGRWFYFFPPFVLTDIFLSSIFLSFSVIVF